MKRKRKVVPSTKDAPVGKKSNNAGKGQATEESTHPEADRNLPNGIWDVGFDLGYKIDFQLNPAEKKVLEGTSRQQLTQNCLELCARATASVWQLVHTADKEKADLEGLQQQLMDLTLVHSECGPKYETALKTINEGRTIFEEIKKSLQAAKKQNDQQALDLVAARKALDELTIERNTLKSFLMASKAKERQMAEVIVLEHTRGFKKAIRQTTFLLDRSLEDLPLDVNNDILGGKIIPSKEVPAGTYPDDDDEEEEDSPIADQSADQSEEAVNDTVDAGEVSTTEKALLKKLTLEKLEALILNRIFCELLMISELC
ncbi:hypothetical protein V8G54_010321 [Vigna mungo]|uniref:Uncharacterized protein n=1 Tax=Vigna mungo TaxID=3915 RepID=A0AAQ3NWG5_VIGMU